MATQRKSERRHEHRRTTDEENATLKAEIQKAEKLRRSDMAFGAGIGAAILGSAIAGPIGAAVGGVAGLVLGGGITLSHNGGSAKAAQ